MEEFTLLRPELDTVASESLEDFSDPFYMFFKRPGITQHIIKVRCTASISEGVQGFLDAALE